MFQDVVPTLRPDAAGGPQLLGSGPVRPKPPGQPVEPVEAEARERLQQPGEHKPGTSGLRSGSFRPILAPSQRSTLPPHHSGGTAAVLQKLWWFLPLDWEGWEGWEGWGCGSGWPGSGEQRILPGLKTLIKQLQ